MEGTGCTLKLMSELMLDIGGICETNIPVEFEQALEAQCPRCSTCAPLMLSNALVPVHT